MEASDAKQYRDHLATQIRNEPDRSLRRSILEKARTTQEYKDAKILKKQEFGEKDTSIVTFDLSRYAQEHYGLYAVYDPEISELLSTIADNRRTFQSDVLPNVSDEQIDSIFAFIDGNDDEGIRKLLKRANFPYEDVLTSDDDDGVKAGTLLEVVLKAQSYDEAVQQHTGKDVDFSGFGTDPDIPDAKVFIYQAFGERLLQQCLISSVKYAFDKVNVNIDGIDYLLPVDLYAEWESKMPEVKSRKFRAESFVRWNTDPNFSKKFIPTPIYFYSFYGEHPENLEYLQGIPLKQRMRQYKLGTIAHEVGHHIYDYLMDADRRREWKEIVDQLPRPVTAYAQTYEQDKLMYDEFFTEAVRLKTTVPDYFMTNFPSLDTFLTVNFPDIKSDQLCNV